MLAALFLLLGVAAVASSQSGPIVNTQYGPVLGSDRGAWNEWLGIPFAAPPGQCLFTHDVGWSQCCRLCLNIDTNVLTRFIRLH